MAFGVVNASSRSSSSLSATVETKTAEAGGSSSAAPSAAVDPKLNKLRELMAASGVDAFIVPSDDPHLSEYSATCFNRREFITGFKGSAGTAVITQTKALLWTDGRYFLQAEKELGPDWTLMRAGQPGTPTIQAWLAGNVAEGGRVGVDPLVHSATFASELSAELGKAGVSLSPLSPQDPNPVDQVWGEARPPLPDGPLRVHPLKYAGESVEAKLEKVRAELARAKAAALVVCALDEVAYLLNVRGCDVAHCPVAIAYALVTRDAATLFIDAAKLPDDVRAHLTAAGVAVRAYADAVPAVAALAEGGARVWVDPARVNSAAWGAVPAAQRVTEATPLSMAKALKNEAELAGMRAAHVRDGAALSEFLCWLEGEVRGGRRVSEVEVDEVLSTRFRAARPLFLDLSFPTIAGAGANGAVIHYRAEPGACGAVDDTVMFLLDSGAQYEDGTTDVTRTMHFGAPTAAQRRAYTLVLKGHIGIDTCVFPEGTPGCAIDAFARRALWAAGLDYAHGTGHGVGASLNVHEGPHSISPRPGNATPLKPGMIVSNEPGYYLAGEFGIRIENLLEIAPAGMRNDALARDFYAFRPLTLVPIQKALIDAALMTPEELDWLDAYHARVWEEVALHVSEDGGARDWLRRATEPIQR
ncbi:peptidase [Tribonema minus]|uniref:Peptidase n=1 Tax=Tribonema minus TaxID=303371 RepID=A0A835ZE52_9STRA|nr:peptidase [Tribonema minus]